MGGAGCCWGLAGEASLGCRPRRKAARGRYRGGRQEGEVGQRRSASCWWKGRRLQRRARKPRERGLSLEGRDAEHDLSPLATAPEGRDYLHRQGDGLVGGGQRREWRENVQRNHLQLVSVWELRL